MHHGFETAYEAWLQQHLNQSGRERRKRIKERIGAAEMAFLREVWFELFGGFDDLAPQLEVYDAEGCKRHLDFAWVRCGIQIDIEVDRGEARNRKQLAEERARDMHLQIAGWHIARFAKEDLLARPQYCRRLLAAWMSRFIRIGKTRMYRDAREDEVLKLAMAGGGTVKFRDVVQGLQVSEKTALAILRRLMSEGLIAADGAATQRVHKYRLRENALYRRYFG